MLKDFEWVHAVHAWVGEFKPKKIKQDIISPLISAVPKGEMSKTIGQVQDRIRQIDEVSKVHLGIGLEEKIREDITNRNIGKELPNLEKAVQSFQDDLRRSHRLDSLPHVLVYVSLAHPKEWTKFVRNAFNYSHKKPSKGISADFPGPDFDTIKHLRKKYGYFPEDDTGASEEFNEPNLTRFGISNTKKLSPNKSAIDLAYFNQFTDFIGREFELELLGQFLDHDRHFCWWQIAGHGGQGKSRLALHLANEYARELDWNTGFITELNTKTSEEALTWNFSKPTLIIIDNVSDSKIAEILPNFIAAIEKRSANLSDIRVRLLLIDREPYDRSENYYAPLSESSYFSPWHKLLFQSIDPLQNKAIFDSMFAPEAALTLTDLSSLELVEIASSWIKRVHENKMEPILSPTQWSVLCDFLGVETTEKKDANPHVKPLISNAQKPASPLMAILAASFVMSSSKKVQNSKESILGVAIELLNNEVRHRFDRSNDTSCNLYDPDLLLESVTSKNQRSVAYLCNMLGTLSKSELSSINLEFDTPELTNEDFVKVLGILGRSISVTDAQKLTSISARNPDLLGEVQIIRAFEASCKHNRNNTTSSEDRAACDQLALIVKQAWFLNPTEMIKFVERLTANFPFTETTKFVLEIIPDKNLSLFAWFHSIISTVYNLSIVGNQELAESIYLSLSNFLESGLEIAVKCWAHSTENLALASIELGNFTQASRFHSYIIEALEKNDDASLFKEIDRKICYKFLIESCRAGEKNLSLKLLTRLMTHYYSDVKTERDIIEKGHIYFHMVILFDISNDLMNAQSSFDILLEYYQQYPNEDVACYVSHAAFHIVKLNTQQNLTEQADNTIDILYALTKTHPENMTLLEELSKTQCVFGILRSTPTDFRLERVPQWDLNSFVSRSGFTGSENSAEFGKVLNEEEKWALSRLMQRRLQVLPLEHEDMKIVCMPCDWWQGYRLLSFYYQGAILGYGLISASKFIPFFATRYTYYDLNQNLGCHLNNDNVVDYFRFCGEFLYFGERQWIVVSSLNTQDSFGHIVPPRIYSDHSNEDDGWKIEATIRYMSLLIQVQVFVQIDGNIIIISHNTIHEFSENNSGFSRPPCLTTSLAQYQDMS